MIYITASGSQSIATSAYGILIQVNAALTGSITVADGDVTKAVITDPTVGSQFRYFGFNGAITVNPNATCDITVSVLNHQG